jgi:N-acylglucosamine-6-phosphate 2-epimerase
MADVSTVEEGVHAARVGADLVATTLAGYTPYSAPTAGPALDLLCRLVQEIEVPVLVEGHIWTLEDVRACFDGGAYAVVIGSAITVPEFITRRFVAAVPQPSQSAAGAAQ